jgi:hypothetical protein
MIFGYLGRPNWIGLGPLGLQQWEVLGFEELRTVETQIGLGFKAGMGQVQRKQIWAWRVSTVNRIGLGQNKAQPI